MEIGADTAERLDAAALIRSAQIVSGNFAALEAGLQARFDRFVGWLNEQPPLGPERKPAVELQLRKLLATRLRLAADRRRIPAIAEERIERPIFVIGFARTGTEGSAPVCPPRSSRPSRPPSTRCSAAGCRTGRSVPMGPPWTC